MDTVWVDTMFPGLDPDEGWEENMKRVVNYDYLLKEYLDWQLKHLTTDNFDPTDWANVTADIISMAAGSVDLTAYYDKDEVDAKAQLILDTADDHADAKLLSYYTKDEADAQAALTLETAEGYTDTKLLSYYTSSQVDGAISAQAVLSQAAAEGYTNTALGSYYTKTEIGDFTGYQSAVAALQAYADNAVATIDLSAYYTATDVDGMFTTSEASVKGYADGLISGLSLVATGSGNTARLSLMSGQTELGSGASLALSVTNNSNGYSYVKLTSGNIDLATSGNITLGGNVVFASGSGTTKGLKYTTINGGTVTTNTISALDVTANTIKANASISSPSISGGTITGNAISSSTISSSTIVGCNIYALDSTTDYVKITGSGFEVYTGGDIRAKLFQTGNTVGLRLGDTSPYGYVQKYQSGGDHYIWIGDANMSVGLRINLSSSGHYYQLVGNPV